MQDRLRASLPRPARPAHHGLVPALAPDVNGAHRPRLALRRLHLALAVVLPAGVDADLPTVGTHEDLSVSATKETGLLRPTGGDRLVQVEHAADVRRVRDLFVPW